jgi:hypothetical protein
MALFIVLSTYVAVILLLAAGPLWAWVALLRKPLEGAVAMLPAEAMPRAIARRTHQRSLGRSDPSKLDNLQICRLRSAFLAPLVGRSRAL